jgi:hypothetical protein
LHNMAWIFSACALRATGSGGIQRRVIISPFYNL